MPSRAYARHNTSAAFQASEPKSARLIPASALMASWYFPMRNIVVAHATRESSFGLEAVSHFSSPSQAALSGIASVREAPSTSRSQEARKPPCPPYFLTNAERLV